MQRKLHPLVFDYSAYKENGMFHGEDTDGIVVIVVEKEFVSVFVNQKIAVNRFIGIIVLVIHIVIYPIVAVFLIGSGDGGGMIFVDLELDLTFIGNEFKGFAAHDKVQLPKTGDQLFCLGFGVLNGRLGFRGGVLLLTAGFHAAAGADSGHKVVTQRFALGGAAVGAGLGAGAGGGRIAVIGVAGVGAGVAGLITVVIVCQQLF